MQRLEALWIAATRVWIRNPSLENHLRRQAAHEAYAKEQQIALCLAKMVQQLNH